MKEAPCGGIGKRDGWLHCDQNKRLNSDVEHPDILSFRVNVIKISFACHQPASSPLMLTIMIP
jgi:hypothetical protein